MQHCSGHNTYFTVRRVEEFTGSRRRLTQFTGVLQQDVQRVSSAHAQRRPWRRAVEAEHMKIPHYTGALLGERDVAELQRDVALSSPFLELYSVGSFSAMPLRTGPQVNNQQQLEQPLPKPHEQQ